MASRQKQIPRKHYSEEMISKCLQAIASGKTMYAGCKEFGVPMSTIRYRMSGRWQKKYKPGPQSVLTKPEEQRIVEWLKGMQDRGFPVSRKALLFKISEYLSSDPQRRTPFRNNRPGRKWMLGFMRRNPGFSYRTPEAISSAGGRVSEKDIRGWFQMIDDWLTKNELREVLDDPARVFNGDETSFYLHPKSKEVIARTGSRNVYEVEQAAGKQNVTVMFSFGATGVVVSPHVILPGKRIRKEVAQSFPPEWGLGQSDRGWMDTHNFREYIRKIFHPFLVKQGVQFPVIFFVDGHASHNALEVADMCQSLGIVLISLYPNTTHITQPADVAVFKTLKSEWQRSVEEWRYEHQGCALTMLHFGRVLSKTVERGITAKTIQNGFRACGLQPFDPNAVDYSRCIAKATTVIIEPPLSSDTFASPAVPQPIVEKEPDESTKQYRSDVGNVTISMDRVIEAYDLIGADAIAKIEGDVRLLSREERIIRFFYREFVRPHIDFHDLPSSKESHITSAVPLEFETVGSAESSEKQDDATLLPMDIDINNCKIIHVEDIEAYHFSNVEELPFDENIGETSDVPFNIISNTEFDESNDSNERVMSHSDTENCAQKDFAGDAAASNESDPFIESPDEPLKDVTNKRQVVKRRRLSSVLKLPPTPRRSAKHRKYVRQYHPILTAGERLEEIRKKEEQTEQMEQQKKQKAMERREAQQKREESKKAKAEERARKKMERKPKSSKMKVKKELVMIRD